MEIEPLETAKPFTAVKNSRGYRLLAAPIYINGAPFQVPVAIERFLRNFRRDDEPVRLWIRHVCLIEAHGEEFTEYWNRPFLDKMYSRAETVIDMAAYNADLLASGKILPVSDSRSAPRTKEWIQTPKPSSPPLIFPLKVGVKFSVTNPTDRFVYVPLDGVADEIRLLVLQGSENWDGPMQLALAHSPIQSDVGPEAVSYTWGPPQPRVDVIMNGQLFEIAQSLDRLLRDLRPKKDFVILWIDAICIDQQNDSERNHQLRRIHEVYDTAENVLALLGDTDGDSDLAVNFIPKLQFPVLRQRDTGEWDVGEPGQFSREELVRHCAATYKFLTRNYFHRVWILQEIAWASNPHGMCGTHLGFGFGQLKHAARNLQELMERDGNLVEQLRSSLPDMARHVHPRELDFIRKIFYFRHLVSQGAGTDALLSSVSRTPETSPGFLETAVLARDFDATDPHDKIFALWNVVQDKEKMEFVMDYTYSLSDSYTKFAQAWAVQHKSLDVIATAEPDPESKVFYEVAPSWCTDWSTPSTASCMVRRETIPRSIMTTVDALNGQLYSADGAFTSSNADDPPFEFDGNKLRCTAYFLDDLADTVVTEGELGFAELLEAMRVYYKEHSNCPYDDADQAFWAMCHGDVPSTWQPRDDIQDKEHIHEKYKGDRDTTRHIFAYVTDIWASESSQVIGAVLRGRNLGFTRHGYMCLLPRWAASDTEPGVSWRLAVLLGCSAPVLLRELEDGTYRVAGSVFVQGWMEGEVIQQQLPSGQDIRSFWDGQGPVSQICIV